jgi:hypothetical protein
MADGLQRVAAASLALLAAISVWLSAGTLAVYGGDMSRVAALPSITILLGLCAAAAAAAWFGKLRLTEAWPLAISLLIWLPFLPGSLPASFVMWEGPIEGVVWLCVIAGLVAARPPVTPNWIAGPSTAPWLAALALSTAWLAVFGQVGDVIPGGDEPHYLAATQSLLHDADLRVANNYAAGQYLDYFPGRLEPHFLKRAASGEIYSIHAPGISVIVLPAFAVAGYTGAVLTMILIAALTAVMTWRLAFRISGSAAGAWAGVTGVFASAPYFFHTFTIYPEVVGSFCVVAGVWLLIDLADGCEVTTRSLIAAGTALAVLPWLHSRFAVLAGILGVLIVVRLIARPSAIARVAWFLSVPILAGGAWFAFFYLIWGSASPMAPYGADTSTSASFIPRGVIGLLVDQQFGVLTTAPIYLIAIAGLAWLFRSRPRLTVELLLVVVPYAITVASYAMWWSGAAAPARFLVAILPLAALPIAAMAGASKRMPVAALILLLVSVALVVPRVFMDEGRFIYNNRSGVDATLRWLTSSVDLPMAVPSVHRSGGTAALTGAAVWIAGLIAAVVFAGATGRRWPRGARFTVTTILLAIAAMTSARVAWSFDSGPSIDTERSKLAALDRLRPSWQTLMIEGGNWERQSLTAFLDRLALNVPMRSSFAIDRVPAAEYEVLAQEAPAVSDRLQMHVGRNDPPLESPTLDEVRTAMSPWRLRVPVTLRTLNFRVGSATAENGTWLTLRPVGVVRAPTSRAAIRALRVGQARAFFFDEWAYPERDGFWTRADGTATVVIDTAEAAERSGLSISITAGAVPTTITVSMGNWRESFSLAAGQRQDVMLPPAESGSWPLRIQSGDGFRPSERDTGSRDVRKLAARSAVKRIGVTTKR